MIPENIQLEILSKASLELTRETNVQEYSVAVMDSYIFGPAGENEHYQIEEIYALVKSKYDELFPAVIVEEE